MNDEFTHSGTLIFSWFNPQFKSILLQSIQDKRVQLRQNSIVVGGGAGAGVGGLHGIRDKLDGSRYTKHSSVPSKLANSTNKEKKRSAFEEEEEKEDTSRLILSTNNDNHTMILSGNA